MWKLSIVDDQGQKTIVNLVRDEYTVGRADGNTIRLTERNVSRHHAVVLRTKSSFLIEDRGSDNGIFVNGVRILDHQELAHKDLLQIGDYRIEVIDEDLATQEQGHQPYSGSVAPPATRLPDRLVVLIGPRQGAEYSLENERHLLGRGEECDVCIDHASVSRVHAEVRKVGEHLFEIVDKASANGLRINGRDMPRALLDSRDVIELGDVVLKFIPHGQVFRASPAEGQRIAALSGASVPPPKSASLLTPGRSLFAALIGAALAAGVAFFLFRGDPDASAEAEGLDSELTEEPAPSAPPAPNAVLEAALEHLRAGDPIGARAELEKLPPKSPLRRSPEFREVERAWAELLLETAEKTDDLTERRQLLDSVARAESVPSELRDTAFTRLQESESPSVDWDDLATTSSKAKPATSVKRPKVAPKKSSKLPSPHDP